MGKNKNILIITYYFPPDPSIGSRRWAKFAKHLMKNGYNVYVLAKLTSRKDVSPWDDDIKGLNISYYKSDYPAILDSNPQSILQKLKYKLALFRIKSKNIGTPYDRAILLEKSITDDARKIIQDKEIDIVISNGPPHRIMYYAIKLKESFPNVKFISDLRDPWTWWYNYGYPTLSTKDMNEEKRMEAEVALKSDLVTVTYPEMRQQVLGRYPDANVFVLPHGYDPDDFESKSLSNNGSRINLVYFGTLYSNEEDRMNQLASVISKKDNLYLDIYSNEKNYKSVFNKYNISDKVKYYQPVSSKKLFSTLQRYDAFIMILPDKFCNNFSSKFYEVLRSGLPFILITKEGDLTEFLQNNKLGFAITNNVEEKLEELFNHWDSKKNDSSFNIEDFSIKNLSQKLIVTISSISQ